MGYVFLVVIVIISVMMYSVCVVSSRCSREEERIAESIEKARNGNGNV
jgi:uncharacterized membrane protein